MKTYSQIGRLRSARPASPVRPANRTRRRMLSGVGNLTMRDELQGRRGREDQLPAGLRRSLEHASGVDLADVRVHRNSAEPARLRAHAVTRGADIYLEAGKDHYLPHEAWHAVQQKQGKVQATSSFQGQAVNTDRGLENEADRMARRARNATSATPATASKAKRTAAGSVAQMAPNQQGTTDPQHLLDFVRRLEAEGLSQAEILDRISEDHATNSNRYVYTDQHGWVDLRHFGAAGSYARSTGSVIAEGLGLGNEVFQWLTEWGDDYRSGFSPEDIPSNAAGAAFGDDYVSDNELLSDSLQRWLEDAGARNQDDPIAGKDSLPATDPSERGGAARGSSNVSRTQSTSTDNPPVNEFVEEWNAGWRALSTPEGWYRLFGVY